MNIFDMSNLSHIRGFDIWDIIDKNIEKNIIDKNI